MRRCTNPKSNYVRLYLVGLMLAVSLGAIIPGSEARGHEPLVLALSDDTAGVSDLVDIIGHPDEIHIRKLADMNVVGGYGNGLFGPDDLVTREQFAKMLVLAAGYEIGPTSTPLTFADHVQISDWARPYVALAVEQGLIKGMDDNTFAPREQVTRAQALVMVARALAGCSDLEALEGASEATGFADDALIPDWVRPALNYALRQGIVTPNDFAVLEHGRPCTRALNCRFLSRLVDALGWAVSSTEYIAFAAGDGVTFNSETGLIVGVAPVAAEGQTVLEVRTNQEPRAPAPVLEAFAEYDITLASDQELPQDPTVTLTFPVPAGVDPANVVVLHEIDGRWTLAIGEFSITDQGLTLVTDHLSKYMMSYIRPVAGKVRAPVTIKTSELLDDEGNLVVTVTITSASGHLRALDAPWMKLSVEND